MNKEEINKSDKTKDNQENKSTDKRLGGQNY